MARILSEITHQEVGVDFVPLPAVRNEMLSPGVQPEFAGLYQDLMQGLALDDISREATHRSVKGTNTLETVLKVLVAQ